MAEKGFESWGILEIMGHVTVAGLISEKVIAGQGFVRIDVPEREGEVGFTRFYGTSSIYSITPCTEEIARGAAARLQQRPITVYGESWERPRLAEPESEQGTIRVGAERVTESDARQILCTLSDPDNGEKLEEEPANEPRPEGFVEDTEIPF